MDNENNEDDVQTTVSELLVTDLTESAPDSEEDQAKLALASQEFKVRNSLVVSELSEEDEVSDAPHPHKNSLGETPRAARAFEDYKHMGPGRTLELLAKEYIKPEYRRELIGVLGWTDNFGTVERTLKTYSSKFGWQKRLRDQSAKAAIEIVGQAQKQAMLNTKTRMKIAQTLQRLGVKIIEQAQLNKLSVAEARKLLKQGYSMINIGLVSEREESGDILGAVRPSKPLRDMTNEELEEYSEAMTRTLK
jgi:hypothetical protein